MNESCGIIMHGRGMLCGRKGCDMGLLNKINQPHDLRQLNITEMDSLAQELRELIIDTVSKNGGHLASNLGVVELTIALHRVFDSPRDRIVWDVGHQAYVHKILTGRRDEFPSLRQFGGLSGFPKRTESRHDAFDTGHSSTSISAALGMAVARDMAGDDYQVVAVIGDGSLTGGQAFEALNHAGMLRRKMIIVLNDNEMSIAKNVGAMSEYLYRMRTAPTYSRIKRDVEVLLKNIPSIGQKVAHTAERVKDSLKYLLVPGMLFEDLGCTYIGPVDGHQLPLLLEIFEKAKTINGPVVIHAVTQKGLGYAPAETNAGKFHGVGPFCVNTGEVCQSPAAPTYTKAFGDALADLAELDPSITAITAAMPDGTGLRNFSKLYPDRFFDVGIAEQHAMTLAAGMAAQGARPLVAVYSTFAQRGYDQILHDICLQELPVVLALDRAGLVGDDGPTHHGVFDYSYLRPMPNMTIMAPKDENELRQMLYTAFQLNAPCAIRYPRGCAVGVPLTPGWQQLPHGKAEQLADGTDVCLWAVGSMVELARQVQRELAGAGISAGLVNARFVKPLDRELLAQTAACGRLVTLEENVLAGGFGAAVLEAVNEFNAAAVPVRVLRLGVPDEFVPHGRKEELLALLQLDAASLVKRITAFVKGVEHE